MPLSAEVCTILITIKHIKMFGESQPSIILIQVSVNVMMYGSVAVLRSHQNLTHIICVDNTNHSGTKCTMLIVSTPTMQILSITYRTYDRLEAVIDCNTHLGDVYPQECTNHMAIIDNNVAETKE